MIGVGLMTARHFVMRHSDCSWFDDTILVPRVDDAAMRGGTDVHASAGGTFVAIFHFAAMLCALDERMYGWPNWGRLGGCSERM